MGAALAGVLAVAGGCGKAPPPAEDKATPAKVWAAIQPLAAQYRMDPEFIYAIVAAESGFDGHARNGEARGLMQLKPGAWRQVSREPYEPMVWDWRTNLATGIDYLAWCRSRLHEKRKFSYPLLLGAFHYGMDFVEDRAFDTGRIPVPENPIYRKLWAGQLAPVPPPG
ncbi:MAG TPA: lytic transglycosylase domain-containing protein [Lacunisphaera sp.]|nr:lytic transglycosylase domain-containing protein [Lacunisphaera sp.]